MRNFCQEIIKSARYDWNKTDSPPILHTRRYSKTGTANVEVSLVQLHPYEIFENSPILRKIDNDKYLMKAVQALWKRQSTNRSHLKKELGNSMKSDRFSIEDLRRLLRWMVQSTPPQFQLDVFSVEFLLYLVEIYYI